MSNANNNNWFRFNPYNVQHVKQGCSCPSSCDSSSTRSDSPPPTPLQVASPLPIEPRQHQPRPAAVPPLAVHRQVLGAEGVSFLPVPSDVPRPSHWPLYPTIDGPFPDLRVFIGQCRFETTAEEIAFILWHTAGLAPHSIAKHRPGCFVANFLNAEEVECCVQLLHRNLLFDTCGVWVARDRAESEALRRYVATSPVHLFKRSRVPRGLVVAEQFRSFPLHQHLPFHATTIPTFVGVPAVTPIAAKFVDAELSACSSDESGDLTPSVRTSRSSARQSESGIDVTGTQPYLW